MLTQVTFALPTLAGSQLSIADQQKLLNNQVVAVLAGAYLDNQTANNVKLQGQDLVNSINWAQSALIGAPVGLEPEKAAD